MPDFLSCRRLMPTRVAIPGLQRAAVVVAVVAVVRRRWVRRLADRTLVVSSAEIPFPLRPQGCWAQEAWVGVGALASVIMGPLASLALVVLPTNNLAQLSSGNSGSSALLAFAGGVCCCANRE